MKNRIVIANRKNRDWLGENEPKKILRTMEDFDKDEAQEINRPKREDLVSELIGNPIHYANYVNFEWRHSKQGMPITVSRFYPHECLVYDEVPSLEELEPRMRLFDRLGIKYMYINPGETLEEEEFMERLTRIRRDYAEADC